MLQFVEVFCTKYFVFLMESHGLGTIFKLLGEGALGLGLKLALCVLVH